VSADAEGKILQKLRIFWYSIALSIQIFYACTDKVKSISLLPGQKNFVAKTILLYRIVCYQDETHLLQEVRLNDH